MLNAQSQEPVSLTLVLSSACRQSSGSSLESLGIKAMKEDEVAGDLRKGDKSNGGNGMLAQNEAAKAANTPYFSLDLFMSHSLLELTVHFESRSLQLIFGNTLTGMPRAPSLQLFQILFCDVH